MATFYSLFIAIMAIVRGSTYYPQYHLTTWTIIAVYYATGTVAGLLIGALRPLLRWRIGSCFVGWIAATAVYFGIGLVMDGPHWSTLVTALGIGFIMGVLLGYTQWKPPRHDAQPT